MSLRPSSGAKPPDSILLEIANLSEQAEELAQRAPELRDRLHHIVAQLRIAEQSAGELPEMQAGLRGIAQQLLEAAAKFNISNKP